MDTQAYFNNISSFISIELKAAKKSIYVAVAWFTDDRIFNILCDKAKAGLDVQLMIMDDDINNAYGVVYSKLENVGGRVYLISDSMGTLMHNKFCVIDGEVTITGSYNWSKKAQVNHENITITSGNISLASDFTNEFMRIKTIYFGKESLRSYDAELVIKRLEIISILLQINDTDEISVHVKKISEYELPSSVDEIIQLLNVFDFNNALIYVEKYLKEIKTIVKYEDADINRLKWEIKYLEIEIISLESEKNTITKIISDFVHNYTIEFGEILLEILKLKKEKLSNEGNEKKSKQYEEAEYEYNQQQQNFSRAKSEEFYDLSEDEKEQLKKAYRKACILCHPDKFTEKAMKEKAHKVFIELQDAYSKNNLARVNEILSNLENGIYDITTSFVEDSKDILKKRVEYLRKKLETLLNELIETRNDKTYRKIISINDMETFFSEEKSHLENQLNKLKNGK